MEMQGLDIFDALSASLGEDQAEGEEWDESEDESFSSSEYLASGKLPHE